MTRFISTLLLLVSFAPAMAIAATDGGKAADVPDIPKIQAYEVSGMRMNVPVGYLRRFDLPPDQTLRIRNTSGQSIQLHLQDPEMISPSPELRKRLRSPRNSPEHVLFRVIIVRDDYTETHLSAIMRKAMIVGKCRAKIAGEICPDSRDLPLRETWETLYTGEKHEFVFCRTWGGVPVPHC